MAVTTPGESVLRSRGGGLAFHAALVGLALVLAGCGGEASRRRPGPAPLPPPTFAGPTASASLVLDSRGERLWVANSEAGTVALVQVEADRLVKAAEVSVQSEPTCVALSPDDLTLYVTNRGSGTVSVVNAITLEVAANIFVGAEPVGCALTPLGDKLYVASSTSNTVAVVDTLTRSVSSVIPVTDGYFPFAVAVTTNDPTHVNEKVYVTQFFAQLPPGTRPALTGDTDTGRVGKVTVIGTATDTVLGTLTLAPRPTGFTSDRTAFGGSAQTPTFAFPNLLNTIVLRGRRGYVVNGAESPEGPVNFQTNEQAFISVFDTVTDREIPSSTINLNASVATESPPGFFLNTPWGLAFSPKGPNGIVLSAASDVAVKISLSADGTPVATGPGGVTRIATGKNPRGVAINPAATRAYVQNQVSRDVTVINLTDDTIVGTVQTTALPAAGTLAASVLRGQELFNSSRGSSSVTTALPGRMSSNGWGSCFSCHPFGWTDTVIWAFADGPRKTIPLNGIFTRRSSVQRILNYSGSRDEVEDFELNIRLVSSNRAADGRTGLFIDVPRTDITNLTPKPNSGRSPDWTAIVDYIKFGIRSPISPLRALNVSRGRIPFAVAGCVSCHAGPLWTSSRRSFTPPPTTPPVTIVNGQLSEVLRQVDTFVTGEVNDTNVVAKGADGFNPPSLLGFWAFPPFLHNGQASTLDELLTRVLNSKAHKDAGIAGQLDDPAVRAELALFLMSIDDATEPEVAQ